ncbi:hypothetical protein [Halorubrum lacusprofundi]|jgi:hypothetical protein|uniref:hypothetical protein n=1 Tax=Halorubrum lacusprofundi TaxID=2247 RepID=UPI0011312819|nr:hypothetical protein [Halorubrum lacusprofundi]MCG1008232.1 hypothetical protein [Halorubrum lacusprofundi]
MGDDCALCVDAAVFDEGLPPEWEEYLRDEREKTFIGSPRVPLCAGCRPEYDILKSGGYGPVSTDDEAVVELLDDLRLDRIVENHGF